MLRQMAAARSKGQAAKGMSGEAGSASKQSSIEVDGRGKGRDHSD